MSQKEQRQKLRKQPKRRRLQAASAVHVPQLQMPETAQKRRRRKKTEPVRFGLITLKRVIFSSRWLSLALLILSVYALVDIYNEQRFYLTYIPVEGSVAISPEEIAQASGLAGRHAFAADPSEAAKSIGELPGIISASVTLQWPNQVFIEVAEESAVAVWVENGVEYGVTQHGRLIPAVRLQPDMLRIESETVAMVQALSGDGTPAELSSQAAQSEPDKPVGVNRVEAVNAAAAKTADDQATSFAFIPRDVLEGALQLHELRPTIDKLYYKPTGGLSYQDGRGWRGYFGTGTQMNQKLAVYETIVTDLLTRGIQPAYISVGNQEKPFYKVFEVPVVEEEQPS